MKDRIYMLISILIFLLSACQKEDNLIPNTKIASSVSSPSENGGSPISSVDERATLQARIYAAAKNKTLLKLEARKYLISGELDIPSNTTIEGSLNTEIFLNDGTSDGRNVLKIGTSATGIKLSHLKINANQAGNAGKDLIGLFVSDRAKNIICSQVIFSGGKDRGVVQVKGTNGGQCETIGFINCQFIGAGRTAIELRGTKNTSILGCTFSNWGNQNSNSPAIQLQSQDNYHILIKNNKFINTHGVQFAIESAGAYVYDAKILDNFLDDHFGLGGNGISGYYKQTIISGNIFTGGNGFWRSGLEIFGQDNIIENNKIGAGSIAISAGLNEIGRSVIIRGNRITNKGINSAGIQIGHGKHIIEKISIVNNIVDTRAASGNSSAIVIGTYGAPQTVKDINVLQNTLYTNAHCIRLQSLPGSYNIQLSKNICKSGATWLAILTNTFKSIRLDGNIIELKDKSITYGPGVNQISN